MENTDWTIGVRALIQAVISAWYWVVGATLLALVAGLVVSLTQPDVFAASAQIYLPITTATFQQVSGVRTDYTIPQTSSFVELAMSDGALEAALSGSGLGTSEGGSWSLIALRRASDATAVQSLLTLTVTAEDPSQAAALVNAWGEAVTQQINDLYAPYGPGGSDLESMTADAKTRLQQAEAAVADYHAQASGEVLSDRRAALGQLLSSYTIAEQSLAIVEQDALSLDANLAARPQSDPPSYQDHYQTALLFTRSAASSALLAGSNTVSAGYFSTQPGLESLISTSQQENVTVADLRSYLAQVVSQSRTARQGMGDSITLISAAIQDAEAQEANYTAGLHQLELERDLASDSYSALTNRAQQESSSLQVFDQVAQLASEASVPGAPEGPGMIQTLIIAAVVGFLVGCGWAIVFDWWKRGNSPRVASGR
jgi:uncharacterized protein involved in exopolysaccharide biosynthesis